MPQRLPRLAAVLLTAALAACGSLAPGADDAAAPLANPAAMSAGAERLIVLTVANPEEPLATHAGSTLRGYDAMPRYAEGAQARAALDAIAADYHLRLLAQWPILPLQVHCVVFQIAAQEDRAALLARLAADPRIAVAQPLQRFATLAAAAPAVAVIPTAVPAATAPYNDPYFGLQRGFAQIDAADAQQWTHGDGVRVALIDTGVDGEHPDLNGRIESRRNFVDDDAAQFEADRHGTAVAGIIAADANNREGIVGVAPGARVLALKACWQGPHRGDGAQCNSFTLAQAMTVAIESGARVINLSLGGPADPLLAQLAGYALKRGVVVVGAVPPDGRTDGFPVGVPGVIAVDAAGGAAVAGVLRAPGHEVLTLTPGGHYDFVSGSSLAAAHVSGAVALLLQVNPRLDPAAVRDLLGRTAAADGVINVCAAVALLRPEGGCPVANGT